MNQPIVDIRGLPDPPRRVNRRGGWRKAAEWLISGWIVLGLGLLFFTAAVGVQYVSCPDSLFPDARLNRGCVEADGIVQRVVRQGFARGRLSYRIEFSYQDERGRTRPGRSFTRRPSVRAGARVPVQYQSGSAGIARITGTTAAVIPMAIFVYSGLILLSGLFLLVVGSRQAAAQRRLLCQGQVSGGTVTRVFLNRKIRINSVSPWVVCYEFQDAAERWRRGRCRVFPVRQQAQAPPCEAGQAVAVIYDPGQPAHNTLAFREDFQ